MCLNVCESRVQKVRKLPKKTVSVSVLNISQYYETFSCLFRDQNVQMTYQITSTDQYKVIGSTPRLLVRLNVGEKVRKPFDVCLIYWTY